MTQNNNLSPLPFYTDLRYQNAKKSYAYGKIFPLINLSGYILPFQIIRPHEESTTISLIGLYDCDGNYIQDIKQNMYNSGLEILQFPEYGYDIIKYSGIINIGLSLRGTYYLRYVDSSNEFFSEMFTWEGNVDKYTKISWWDDKDTPFEGGHIDYSSQYKNYVYVDCEVGKPDYPFEEEGEDRDGFFFPEKQISYKLYKMVFLASEFLCDALRLVRMSDNMIVESDGITYRCDTFLITPKWEIQGDIASVETEFRTDTVVKKIGRAYVRVQRGSFNNDYNDDFD